MGIRLNDTQKLCLATLKQLDDDSNLLGVRRRPTAWGSTNQIAGMTYSDFGYYHHHQTPYQKKIMVGCRAALHALVKQGLVEKSLPSFGMLNWRLTEAGRQYAKEGHYGI